VVTTTFLPSARVGKTYSAQLTATGGKTPYTWAIIDGNPPLGITLNPDGSFTGEAQSTFLTFFTVQVTDDNGDTATKDLSIRVQIPNCVNCHASPGGLQ
jgi:hypothetical protein